MVFTVARRPSSASPSRRSRRAARGSCSRVLIGDHPHPADGRDRAPVHPLQPARLGRLVPAARSCPSLFGSAFFIFLFRQWFRNLPPHLLRERRARRREPVPGVPPHRPAAGVARSSRRSRCSPSSASGTTSSGRSSTCARPTRSRSASAWRRSRASTSTTSSLSVAMALHRAHPADRRVRRRPAVPRARHRVGWLAWLTRRSLPADPPPAGPADHRGHDRAPLRPDGRDAPHSRRTIRRSPRPPTRRFGRFPLPVDDPRPAGRPAVQRAVAVGDAAPTMGPVVNRMTGNFFLITAGSHDFAVADLDGGVAAGFVSEATARDGPAVRYSFIEAMALSMLARSRGYFVLHAGGVVRGDRGIALHRAGRRRQVDARGGLRAPRLRGLRRGRRSSSASGRSGSSCGACRGSSGSCRTPATLFPELAGAAGPPPTERRVEDRRRARRPPPGARRPVRRTRPDRRCCRATMAGRRASSPSTTRTVADGPRGPLAVGRRLDRRARAGGASCSGRWRVYRLHVNGTPDEAVDALEELRGERGRRSRADVADRIDPRARRLAGGTARRRARPSSARGGRTRGRRSAAS